MSEQQTTAQDGEQKSNLLPATLTMLQSFFLVQVLVGIIVIVIAYPLGIGSGVGFWIYDIGGMIGYLVSVLILTIALIFLIINARRVGARIHDVRENKASTILVGSIFIILALIGVNIAYGILYNSGDADIMAVVFVTTNILVALLVGMMINYFDAMLVTVTKFSTMEKGSQFMRFKPLLITAIIWAVAFTIVAPIMFSLTGNITPRVESIELVNFIGMFVYGIVGFTVICFMKEKWIKEFQKRAIILSKK